MSTLMPKPTGPTLEGQSANMRRQATPNPAFKPEFRRSVMMHPVLAGSVAAIIFLLLVVFALQQKPMYSAESLIYIEPFNSKVLGDSTVGGFDSTKYESSIAQQMLTAQRTDIISTALNTLPHQVWAAYGPTVAAAATNLQGQLKVARVTTSYQVSIGLKGPNAANTAAIVNAVTTAYLEAGRKDEISQADQRSQLLTEERGRIEQDLTKTRAEQTRLGAQLGVANPGVNNANPYDSQLDALRAQLVTARAGHDQAAAQLAAISGVNASHASGLTAAANDIINGDSGLSSMKSTINQRRAVISSQMAGLTPNNPTYKMDQDELTDLDKTLDSMTVQLRDRASRQLQDKLRTELERTSDVESRINGELARQTSTATTASPRLQRAAELNADLERLMARYTTVDNALHSLQLETSGPGMAHLAMAATVPTGPEPSKQRLILLAALPIALLGGLFAAVFVRKRDRRIYIGGDVDDVLGFAPIAILPARAEVSAHVLDEYALRLAAGVEGAYRSGNARTFVITPVSNNTDITPLVQALEAKLSELGLGVVIVQAATVFEQQHPEPAATSELAGYDPAFDRHYEGLADTLFSRMKAEHDVILLHAPAILISAQAEYVARCSDVTLLVAESAVTTRGELFQAGLLLQRLNITGVGSVLEEVQLRFADSAFARGVRTLEGLNRPARKTATVEATLAPEPAYHYEVPPAEEVTTHFYEAPSPVAHPQEAGPISVPAVETPWYPDHVEAVAETPAPHANHSGEPVADFVAEPPAHPVAKSTAESEEPEYTSPVALFDSLETAPERRKLGSLFGAAQTAPAEDAQDEQEPKRGWFKRLINRDSEPAVSLVPSYHNDADEQEEHVAPAAAYDQSRYDLPLPVQHLAEVASPAFHEPVVAMHAAEPEPIHFEPVPLYVEPAAPVQLVEAPLPEPVLEPVFVAPVETTPAAPAPAVYAFAPEAVAAQAPEPVRVGPARPLSFLELSKLQQPSAPVEEAAQAPEPARPTPTPYQHFEAATPAAQPEPVGLAAIETEQHFEAPSESAPVVHAASEPEPEYVPAPAANTDPTHPSDEWNPAPLNRWDPIPPLRQQEPWRISSGSTRAAQQPSRDVWRGEDPVHLPPSDRWVSPESLAPEAPPAESTDVVLTRRWGLLSRFQQGESFQSTHRPSRLEPLRQQEPRQPEKTEDYAQEFGHDYDPEYDRPRR